MSSQRCFTSPHFRCRRGCTAHVRKSVRFEQPSRMAGVHRRRQNPGDPNVSPNAASPESGASGDTSTVLFKLLAAAFYGFSSFLIVVVNKSVLTNYR